MCVRVRARVHVCVHMCVCVWFFEGNLLLTVLSVRLIPPIFFFFFFFGGGDLETTPADPLFSPQNRYTDSVKIGFCYSLDASTTKPGEIQSMLAYPLWSVLRKLLCMVPRFSRVCSQSEGEKLDTVRAGGDVGLCHYRTKDKVW